MRCIAIRKELPILSVVVGRFDDTSSFPMDRIGSAHHTASDILVHDGWCIIGVYVIDAALIVVWILVWVWVWRIGDWLLLSIWLLVLVQDHDKFRLFTRLVVHNTAVALLRPGVTVWIVSVVANFDSWPWEIALATSH